MAIYERTTYKRGKLGVYKQVGEPQIFSYPYEIGRWKANEDLEKRDGDITRYKKSKTKRGLSYKVDYAKTVNNARGEKYKTRLITTGSKLPNWYINSRLRKGW